VDPPPCSPLLNVLCGSALARCAPWLLYLIPRQASSSRHKNERAPHLLPYAAYLVLSLYDTTRGYFEIHIAQSKFEIQTRQRTPSWWIYLSMEILFFFFFFFRWNSSAKNAALFPFPERLIGLLCSAKI
jgi:hypothetical protein